MKYLFAGFLLAACLALVLSQQLHQDDADMNRIFWEASVVAEPDEPSTTNDRKVYVDQSRPWWKNPPVDIGFGNNMPPRSQDQQAPAQKTEAQQTENHQ